jgi:hypothetical protein
MSEHLSPREISAWMLGERDSAGVEHARECPSCRGAVEGLETAMADFRLAVRKTGEVGSRETRVPAGIRRPAMAFPLLWRGLAVAGVALGAILVAVAPEYPRGGSALPVDSAADAALMRQVQADVSQAVPDSMEPLLQLVATENYPGQGNNLLER